MIFNLAFIFAPVNKLQNKTIVTPQDIRHVHVGIKGILRHFFITLQSSPSADFRRETKSAYEYR